MLYKCANMHWYSRVMLMLSKTAVWLLGNNPPPFPPLLLLLILLLLFSVRVSSVWTTVHPQSILPLTSSWYGGDSGVHGGVCASILMCVCVSPVVKAGGEKKENYRDGKEKSSLHSSFLLYWIFMVLPLISLRTLILRLYFTPWCPIPVFLAHTHSQG